MSKPSPATLMATLVRAKLNPDSMTIAADVVHTWLQIARSCGVDVTTVLQRVGIQESQLSEPDARITGQQSIAIWRELGALAPTLTFGLRMGCYIRMSDLGLLGYMMLNAPTIAEALRIFSDYQNLLYTVNATYIDEQGDRLARVIWGNWLAQHPGGSCAANFCLSADKTVVDILRDRTGASPVVGVHFAYRRPEALSNLSDYVATFGEEVEVRFGCPDTRIIFNRHLLGRPVAGANPELFQQFEAQGNAIMRQQNLVLFNGGDRQTLTNRVRQELVQQLQGQLPTLDDIAADLLLSSRSLQHQLKQEDTSFTQVLDEVRRELAMQYVQNTQFNKTEIAYLLGFSDLSAFSRTFKRWTGYSPSEFQKQN